MLTLFRTIRRKLIQSGSVRRYLIYGIGEVMLVMVGILLAFQVNNWNERRKQKDEEKVVLQTIANTLKSNHDFFQYAIWGLGVFDKSGEIISKLLDERDLESDTLYRHFHQALLNGAHDFFISEIGYSYIRNTNGRVINNIDLRNQIIQLFEFDFQNVYRQYSWGKDDNPEINAFIDENFERTRSVKLIPYDVNDLYGSRMYNSLIKKASAQRGYFIGHIIALKEKTHKLLLLVEEELEKY